MTHPVEAWLTTVHQLTTNLAARWPKLAADLDDVTHLAAQIAHAQPRAEAVTDPGDGLRSPSLEPGSRPIGSHSDPTASTAIAHRTGRHADTLATSATYRREATHSLRMALSVETAGEAAQHIHDARSEATRALAALHRLLPATNTIRRLTPTGDPGCASCRRIKDSKGRPFFSDARTPGSTHCRDCQDFLNAYGKLPSTGVLEMIRDGVRRTKARTDQAEAAERWRATRKKRRAS